MMKRFWPLFCIGLCFGVPATLAADFVMNGFPTPVQEYTYEPDFSLVSRYDMKVSGKPYNPLIDPLNRYVAYADAKTKTVNVININIQPYQAIFSMPVQNGIISLAASTNGRILFVANNTTGEIYKIDLNDPWASPPELIMVNPGVIDVKVSRDMKYLYTLNRQYKSFDIIRLHNLHPTLVNRIAIGNYPLGMALSRDGKKMVVTNGGDNTVSIINIAKPEGSLSTVKIGVGQLPKESMINARGSQVLVSNSLDDTVSVIDLANNVPMVEDTLSTGDRPTALKANFATNMGLLLNSNNNTISILDVEKVADRLGNNYLTTVDQPENLSVSDKFIVIANKNSESLSILSYKYAQKKVPKPMEQQGSLANMPLPASSFTNTGQMIGKQPIPSLKDLENFVQNNFSKPNTVKKVEGEPPEAFFLDHSQYSIAP